MKKREQISKNWICSLVWTADVESKCVPQPLDFFFKGISYSWKIVFAEVKQSGNKTYVSSIFLLIVIYYSLRRR